MGKAHKVNVTTKPRYTGEGVVAHVYCPSGCFKGYLWGDDVEALNKVLGALMGAHRIDKDSPTGHEACEFGERCRQ